MRVLPLLLGLAIVVGSAGAAADAPLSMPSPTDARKVCSRDGRSCVFMDLKSGTVAYAMTGDTKGAQLWSVERWFRVAALANDGVHLVTGYEGSSLISQKYDPKMVMITFYRSGKPFHEVRLDELVTNFKLLRKTVSHVAWGHFPDELDDRGLYVVHTEDGRTIAFDPTTGLAVAADLPVPDAASLAPPPAISATAATSALEPPPASSAPGADAPRAHACGCLVAGGSVNESAALVALALSLSGLLRRRSGSTPR